MSEIIPWDVSTHSAAYKLFHYPIAASVPASVYWDVNDTHYFGIATTGVPEVDVAAANTMEDKSLTVAEMAYYVAQGSPLSLCDPMDAERIYKYIYEHLTDWYKILSTPWWSGEIPLEGLMEFNQLAKLMIRIARRYGFVKRLINEDSGGRVRLIGGKQKPHASSIVHNDQLMQNILERAYARGIPTSKYGFLPAIEKNKGSIPDM